MHSIAIFGGTFDPVHQGHMQTSILIQNTFKFDTYNFLPCKIPALKDPARATNQQRITMLELALKDHPEFSLDLREMERDSPSYMVETLDSFRLQYKEASLTLIMGYDALLSLPQWHQWERIITLANLLVINRASHQEQPPTLILSKLLQQHSAVKRDDITHHQSGMIYFFDAGNFAISSTQIRGLLKERLAVDELLPEDVNLYIQKSGLYF